MPNNKSRQHFGKENRRKTAKHAAQVPQTADEYLAAGVDFEEAGEKWRAGDAAKSTRFFVRAVDAYDEALKKFPNSFDLAYNKARVQYELTQHPRLLAHLPGTSLDLLKTALESSRVALDLRQDNADVLFNTAQVLTSLVEALTEDRSGTVSNEDCLLLLEEAIELFQRCLTLQEYHYAESQAQEEATAPEETDIKAEPADPADGPATSEAESIDEDDRQPLSPMSSTIPDSEASSKVTFHTAQEERWAEIVEPVTNDTLLDTLLAQLETLTTLCGLISANEGRGLAWIEEYSSSLLSDKMPAYVKGTDREEEAALTRANFVAALADANFRSDRTDTSTYERILEEAFQLLNLANDPEGLCDRAESLIMYNYSVCRHAFEPGNAKEAMASRWNSLTLALDSLTAASKLPSAENLAKIHLMRGDVELLRFQLGQGLAPTPYDVATRNAKMLLKNADTYYRGAESLGVASKLDQEVKEAVIKAALAASLGGQGDRLRELIKTEPEVCQNVLEEAVDDGLITIEWLLLEGITSQ